MLATSRRHFLALGCGALAGELLFAARSARAAPLWVEERQAGPFIVHSTFPLGSYGQLFDDFPKLQRELRGTLAIAPPREPIYVYLLANQSQHENYVRERFPRIPYRRALFVKNARQMNVFAYRQTELATDLRHECTHALLHCDIAGLPLWLDEGFAEYFETPPGKRAFDDDNLDELRWSFQRGIVVDMQALEEKRELTELTAGDYRFAWAWTHFLLHGPTAANRELAAFLADLRRGAPAGDLSQRVAIAVPNPSEQLLRHFRQWEAANAATDNRR
jgi:hypothetical protein